MSEVLGLSHAHEAWTTLEAPFSHRSKTRELQLKDELQLMQRGSKSVAEFSRLFKGLYDQLAAIGRPIDDSDKVHWFLRALGPNYKIFSSTMLSQLPLPSFANIIPKALSHEIFESFQCDGGTEFTNNKFRSHLTSCGIVLRIACPYTSSQNGIAERKHRHVTETGLTIMFHACVSLFLWVEAFSTTVYLINRLPSQTLDGKTPYELLLLSPSVSIPTTSTNTHPMVTRGKPGIFKPKAYHALTLSPSSQFFQVLLAIQEPRGFKSAAKHPEWLSAIDDEIQALKKKYTWNLVRRPINHNVVGCRWIFKTKLHVNGSIESHKARLMAKGFSQIHGLNFEDTFSPMVCPATIRIILSITVLTDGPYIN
ncbi:hypothetical protein AAG906_012318 [Vitis piasezkii]